MSVIRIEYLAFHLPRLFSQFEAYLLDILRRQIFSFYLALRTAGIELYKGSAVSALRNAFCNVSNTLQTRRILAIWIGILPAESFEILFRSASLPFFIAYIHPFYIYIYHYSLRSFKWNPYPTSFPIFLKYNILNLLI